VYSRKPKYCNYVERVSVVTWWTESHSSKYLTCTLLCCCYEKLETDGYITAWKAMKWNETQL
jgi:hypothetical protein